MDALCQLRDHGLVAVVTSLTPEQRLDVAVAALRGMIAAVLMHAYGERQPLWVAMAVVAMAMAAAQADVHGPFLDVRRTPPWYSPFRRGDHARRASITVEVATCVALLVVLRRMSVVALVFAAAFGGVWWLMRVAPAAIAVRTLKLDTWWGWRRWFGERPRWWWAHPRLAHMEALVDVFHELPVDEQATYAEELSVPADERHPLAKVGQLNLLEYPNRVVIATASWCAFAAPTPNVRMVATMAQHALTFETSVGRDTCRRYLEAHRNHRRAQLEASDDATRAHAARMRKLYKRWKLERDAIDSRYTSRIFCVHRRSSS